MKPLDLIMKEVFQEYLRGINIFITLYDAKLSEMIEVVKQNNSSNPHRAVGLLTQNTVKKFEEQR